MTDTLTSTNLREARDRLGYSREHVVRRPELDPPITTKTLERWESGETPVKGYRLRQLARIYEMPDLIEAA